MKKLTYFLAAAAMLALSSCEDDKTPVYTPVDASEVGFTLNTPAYSTSSITLTQDGKMSLQVQKQPEYGYPAAVHYKLYAAIDPAVFELGNEDFLKEDAYRAIELTSADTDRTIEFTQEALAVVMCELNGFNSDDNFDPAVAAAGQKLYLMAAASLQGVAGSTVYSNTVSIENVAFYKAFKSPAKLYVIGSFTGWDIASTNYLLWERDDQIGSNIYYGTFDLPAGTLQFRFYTELGSWGNDNELPSIGSQGVDADVAVEGPTQGSPVEYDAFVGKGNWKFDWAGGELTIKFDYNTMKVSFYAGAAQMTYEAWVVGTPAGWEVPNDAEFYAPYKLISHDNILFTGSMLFPEGKNYFRIFGALEGWTTADQFGAATEGDVNVDITFGTYDAFVGEGNWVLDLAAETGVIVSLNKSSMQMTAEEGAFARYTNPNGWEKVFIYAWQDGGETISAAWPGDAALKDANGNLYWVASKPGMPTNIIFNNGDGEQTVDLPFVNGQTFTEAQ